MWVTSANRSMGQTSQWRTGAAQHACLNRGGPTKYRAESVEFFRGKLPHCWSHEFTWKMLTTTKTRMSYETLKANDSCLLLLLSVQFQGSLLLQSSNNRLTPDTLLLCRPAVKFSGNISNLRWRLLPKADVFSNLLPRNMESFVPLFSTEQIFKGNHKYIKFFFYKITAVAWKSFQWYQDHTGCACFCRIMRRL